MSAEAIAATLKTALEGSWRLWGPLFLFCGIAWTVGLELPFGISLGMIKTLFVLSGCFLAFTAIPELLERRALNKAEAARQLEETRQLEARLDKIRENLRRIPEREVEVMRMAYRNGGLLHLPDMGDLPFVARILVRRGLLQGPGLEPGPRFGPALVFRIPDDVKQEMQHFSEFLQQLPEDEEAQP